MSALTTLSTFDEVTRGLSEVARLSTSADDVDHLLSAALDALAHAIPYDLAAVLELVDDRLEVRCARGPLATPEVIHHRVPVLPGSTVAVAIKTRRARVMEGHEHAEGSDPYHGVIDLPDGHGCLVVPLVAADEVLGVMTFDRSSCGAYPSPLVDLASIYGQLVALAMIAARHAEGLARDNRRLTEENRLLSEEARSDGAAGVLLRASRAPSMARVVKLAAQVAGTTAPVLITGETGTGKEVLARAIHEWSPRCDQPFVKINCAALPESLLESELFGHVKGAFSGAERDRAGRFLVADKGTLLLDEVGELPLGAQAKLLRVLQEGTFEPVGSDQTLTVDVRILAATHVDFDKAIGEGRFREDLYYRLGVFPVDLPPLRARREDILGIARRFLGVLAERTGRGPWTLNPESERRLEGHSWPGNVRELINVLERAAILQPRGELEVELGGGRPSGASSPPPAPWRPPEIVSAWPTLAEVETQYLQETLQRTGGKIYGSDGAAALVGMKPTTLQSRLAKRGIDKRRSPLPKP